MFCVAYFKCIDYFSGREKELFLRLSITSNFVVSFRRGFLFVFIIG